MDRVLRYAGCREQTGGSPFAAWQQSRFQVIDLPSDRLRPQQNNARCECQGLNWVRTIDDTNCLFIGMLQRSPRCGLIALTLATAACVTSHVLVGEPHAALLPSQVQLYTEAPRRTLEKIAVVNTSSKYSLAFTSGAKTEVVIRRLTKDAAKLGANGVWLQGISDGNNVRVDTAVGTEFDSAHGSIDLGFIGTGLFTTKYGRAIAIYIEPDPDAQ
jgi:hypothetical protein